MKGEEEEVERGRGSKDSERNLEELAAFKDLSVLHSEFISNRTTSSPPPLSPAPSISVDIFSRLPLLPLWSVLRAARSRYPPLLTPSDVMSSVALGVESGPLPLACKALQGSGSHSAAFPTPPNPFCSSHPGHCLRCSGKSTQEFLNR